MSLHLDQGATIEFSSSTARKKSFINVLDTTSLLLSDVKLSGALLTADASSFLSVATSSIASNSNDALIFVKEAGSVGRIKLLCAELQTKGYEYIKTDNTAQTDISFSACVFSGASVTAIYAPECSVTISGSNSFTGTTVNCGKLNFVSNVPT